MEQTLPRRRLGQTGLESTVLALGAAPLGNMVDTFGYGVPEERALATVRAVLTSPIRFIDTAALYGMGESERRIGLVLREAGGLPADMLLNTKVGYHPAPFDYSAEAARRGIAGSLERLGLSQLDLVHIHDVEYSTFEAVMGPGGALAGLRQLQADGVIGHIGLAAGPIDMMRRYVATGEFESIITHNRYTLLDQTALPLIEEAAARGMAVMNAAPYASGLLAKGADSAARYIYKEPPPVMRERTRRLDAVCHRYGVPLTTAALQFSLRQPAITATIVGFTTPERIEPLVEAASAPVNEALWTELDALVAEFNAADARG
jgi:D-threo-aldose 1-dehydrogenase